MFNDDITAISLLHILTDHPWDLITETAIILPFAITLITYLIHIILSQTSIINDKPS